MTHSQGAYTTSDATGSQSTTSVAKQETARVAESAKGAGGHVTQTAAEQARQVADEARHQARNLVREGQQQVRDQVRTGQHRTAEGISRLADELREMADRSEQSGMATEVARQASSRLHEVAAWLDKREPGDLVNELRSWARQRPGTFLLGAALAGVVAGRLTSGAIGAARQGSTGPQYGQPGYTGQTGYAGQSEYEAPYAVTPAAPTEPIPAAGTEFGTGMGTTPAGGPPTAPAYPTTTQQGAYDETYQDPYSAEPHRQQGGQVTP